MILRWENPTYAAFTLIELLIVITIIGIISLATYLPYAHHQKKIILKQSVKEITQSLSEARNLAINGVNTGSWNLNVALYFSSWATEILYYAIPHDRGFNVNNLPSETYKIKELAPGIQIDSIGGLSQPTLFSYSAIFWSGSFFPASIATWSGELLIDVSYKWSTSPALQKTIRYFTQSYISDY